MIARLAWLLLYSLAQAAKLLIDWVIDEAEKRVRGEDGKDDDDD